MQFYVYQASKVLDVKNLIQHAFMEDCVATTNVVGFVEANFGEGLLLVTYWISVYENECMWEPTAHKHAA